MLQCLWGEDVQPLWFLRLVGFSFFWHRFRSKFIYLSICWYWVRYLYLLKCWWNVYHTLFFTSCLIQILKILVQNYKVEQLKLLTVQCCTEWCFFYLINNLWLSTDTSLQRAHKPSSNFYFGLLSSYSWNSADMTCCQWWFYLANAEFFVHC